MSLTVNVLILPLRSKNSRPGTQLIVARQQRLSTLSFLEALAFIPKTATSPAVFQTYPAFSQLRALAHAVPLA